MPNETISIIIPAHNEEKYIQTCLDSIKATGDRKTETIVVANACRDKTAGKANGKADQIIEIEEAGISNARNIGAAASRGEILVFLDADCTIDRGILNAIREAVDKNCIGGKTAIRPLDDKRWRAKMNTFIENRYSIMAARSRLMPDGSGACVFITRQAYDLLLKTYGFCWNPEKPRLVDVEFFKRLKKHGKFRFLQKNPVMRSMRRFKSMGYLKSHLEEAARFNKSRDWNRYK